ncbi:uncharacterized protein MELLADRAFT_102833 [Melampsora larici-populina 98AG31]|uniref:Uncharacterized protein n=1 Tax=Melampsora larici-populina (strain 98AG31 / pathotype 3-4-7) TaxID=747676 RepID=F4R9J2_MELLP|nr:uncharacterized protein MELLADRAFT_102833 [Melampsora larici-populina 98AG31]EGG11139.1 hypothetical protein MELLADRAFT_102833 [Melampsora larici-populina 98AG31]
MSTIEYSPPVLERTALSMRWSGIVTLHNENYVQGAHNDEHRCFAAESKNPNAGIDRSHFTVTVDDTLPLEDGAVVELSGYVTALNNGEEAVVHVYGALRQLSTIAVELSNFQVDVLNVTSRGIITEPRISKGNWSSLVVQHTVWITAWRAWRDYTAIYVDVGDVVIPKAVDLLAGVMVDLEGTLLEFSETGNMWAIHGHKCFRSDVIVRRDAVKGVPLVITSNDEATSLKSNCAYNVEGQVVARNGTSIIFTEANSTSIVDEAEIPVNSLLDTVLAQGLGRIVEWFVQDPDQGGYGQEVIKVLHRWLDSEHSRLIDFYAYYRLNPRITATLTGDALSVGNVICLRGNVVGHDSLSNAWGIEVRPLKTPSTCSGLIVSQLQTTEVQMAQRIAVCRRSRCKERNNPIAM